MDHTPIAHSTLQIIRASASSISDLKAWKEKQIGAVTTVDQILEQLEALQLRSRLVSCLEEEADKYPFVSQRVAVALGESLGRCSTVLQCLDTQLSSVKKDKHGSIGLQKGRYVWSVENLLEHLNNLRQETRWLDLLLDICQRPDSEDKLRLLQRSGHKTSIFKPRTEDGFTISASSTENESLFRNRRRLSFSKRGSPSTSSLSSLLGERLGESYSNNNSNRAEARKALSNIASALKPRRSRAESAPLPFDKKSKPSSQQIQDKYTPILGAITPRASVSGGGFDMVRGSTMASCPSTLYQFGRASAALTVDDDVPSLEYDMRYSRPEADHTRSPISSIYASSPEVSFYAPRSVQHCVPPLPIEYIPTPTRSAATSPQSSFPMSFQNPSNRQWNPPSSSGYSESGYSCAYPQATTLIEADTHCTSEAPAAYSNDCPPSYYSTTNYYSSGLTISAQPTNAKSSPHQHCTNTYCIESHPHSPCTSVFRYTYNQKPSIDQPSWLLRASATLEEGNEEEEDYLYLADVRTHVETPAIFIPKPTWLQLL